MMAEFLTFHSKGYKTVLGICYLLLFLIRIYS